jgi:hypothetical protein
MKTRLLVSSVVLALLPAFAAADRDTPPHHRGFPPPETVKITVDGEHLTFGPYTTDDFVSKSDPVNLVFLHTDPRAIRQELMKLTGNRTEPPLPGLPAFPLVPPFNCQWTDAMGYEQAAYAKPEGWVGGEVQLACVNPAMPLGDPFRFHLRLFRSGPHTYGAAHFEVLITNSAEHEVLSWDFAREFVMLDVLRTGTLVPVEWKTISPVPAGTFREVRRLVYDGVRKAAGDAFITLIGLPLLPDGSTATVVPIPTSGTALVFSPMMELDRVKSDVTTKYTGTYATPAPKPFCGSASDWVFLSGTLKMELRVQTNPSGKFLRTYGVSGMLSVTPVEPGTWKPLGPPVPAVIYEAHRGMLTDNYGEVTERASQTLLSRPVQFKAWTFGAGQHDYFWEQIGCGLP